jgi:sulfide:quinone oxidoreductase
MGQTKTQRDTLRVLIAGGGVASLEAALALRHEAGDRVDVEILAPEEHFTYRPLAVAEPFRVGEVRTFPLSLFAEAAGARLRRGTVTAVDPDAHVVRTSAGERIPYDVLLLAFGAKPVDSVPGAFTFRGPEDDEGLARLLADAREGRGRRIAFVVPSGATWPLPAYELALLADWHLTESCVGGHEVTLVTAEDEPLRVFGPEASRAVAELLEIRGIGLRSGAPAVGFEQGVLGIVGSRPLPVDHVVALPRLVGRPIEGIPSDRDGFVGVDVYGGVRDVDDVYAAGDMTNFPLKQGGIAAQMADAAASAIAVRAGVPIAPQPFRPVIRGLLLTGGVPRYLRAEAGGRGSMVDAEPLWWPPAKIVGRYLAPFLAEHAGIREEPPRGRPDEAVAVDVELEFEAGEIQPVA